MAMCILQFTEQARIAAEQAAKKRKKTIAIISPIIVACIAFVIVLITVIIPSSRYNSAMELYHSKKYINAYNIFNSLNYKDSAEKAAECLFLEQKAGLTNVSVGSIIKYGFYEQDNNTSNGEEEIEWKVLGIEGNKALVISQYALDCKPYNDTRTDITWETCTLRKWLNETFYNAAFDANHQKMIISSTVTADKNPLYSTSPGNTTTDNVFLLSSIEVNKYFSSDTALQCWGTAYCCAQGAITNKNGSCWWWLRSPGYYSDGAEEVVYRSDILGDSISICWDPVNDDGHAVRPALWLDLGS